MAGDWLGNDGGSAIAMNLEAEKATEVANLVGLSRNHGRHGMNLDVN